MKAAILYLWSRLIQKTWRINVVKKVSSILRYGLFVFLYLLSVTAQAADTDIYIGMLSDPDRAPNVLFMIDTSDSMETPLGDSGVKRMDVVKQAFSTVINKVERVNIGLARLSYNGGTLLYPVSYLENKVSSGSGEITVRESLRNVVDNIQPAGDKTPSTMALYEAALYMQGGAVDYGRYRAPEDKRNSNNNDYGYQVFRTSTPLSYTPESTAVHMPVACPDRDSDDDACWQEHIVDEPNYVSPIKHSCQSNHIVLLSDGNPNGFSRPVDAPKVESLTGSACASSSSCGRKLAEHISSADLNSSLSGDQSAKVHTIGLDIDNSYLRYLAEEGQGTYLSVDNADSLLNQFTHILSETVVDTAQTYVTPVVSTDAFNQLLIGSEVYFSIFLPSDTQRWAGNLKRYRFASGELVGKNGKPAVINGQFSSEVQSAWSAGVDGQQVTEGGAGERLVNKGYASRTIYTYLDLGQTNNPMNVSLKDNNDHLFHPDNTKLTNPALWPVEMSASQVQDTVRWARGKDIDDEDQDGITDETRWAFCAPLHAQVLAVNYGRNNTRLFLPTNCGVMHFIDANTGDEDWAFMPVETFDRQLALRENLSGDPIYTADGQPTLFLNDRNRNGEIKASEGDQAIIYVPFRRGGDVMYALDVTRPEAPKVLWRISSRVPGFSALRQTWSRPVVTKVMYNNSPKNVVIFGGGYPDDYDVATFRGAHKGGEAIYIVDAYTGQLLLSMGGSGNEGLRHEDMKYPIVSAISVQDMRGADAVTDRLYFADLGGNVWRVDLEDDLEDGDHLIEKLAELGTDANPQRFFYPPLVTYFSEKNGKSFDYLYILISSGDRENPFSSDVKDAIFAIRDYQLAPLQSAPTFVERKYTQNDLYDATQNLLQDGETEAIRNQERQWLNDAKGWYIDLEDKMGNAIGEKGLSSGRLHRGVWYLTTYLKPDDDNDTSACDVSQGMGHSKLYALSLDGGQAVLKNDVVPLYRDARVFDATSPGMAEGLIELSSAQPGPGGTPQCALGFGMTYLPAIECSNSLFYRSYWWQR